MAPEDKTNCVLGTENKTRIDNLDREVTEIKLNHTRDKIELFKIITEIRDKLLGRPSWVVLFIMAAMSSALVGLVIIIMTHAMDK